MRYLVSPPEPSYSKLYWLKTLKRSIDSKDKNEVCGIQALGPWRWLRAGPIRAEPTRFRRPRPDSDNPVLIPTTPPVPAIRTDSGDLAQCTQDFLGGDGL